MSSSPDDHVFACLHNINIMHWMTQPTAEHVKAVTSLTRKLVAEHPEGVSCVTLVREGTGLPVPEARAAFSALLKDVEAHIACVGVVIMGGGFWASTIQSAVTALRLGARRNFITRFTGNAKELSTWLPSHHFERTGVAISGQGLLQAIDKVLGH